MLPAVTFAQEDTTPPVLLDFTLSPFVVDAGPGAVTVAWCATARDNFSEIEFIRPGIETIVEAADYLYFDGPLEASGCSTILVPKGTAYGLYKIVVLLKDIAGDLIVYTTGRDPDLCDVGTCLFQNRRADPIPDSDHDGVPDDADNCPDDPNPNQEDSDLDLIGDVCDPFPDNPNNDLAQCEEDLSTCLETGGIDQDSDGEPDVTDLCPDSIGQVDSSGCSPSQFCNAFDISTSLGKQTCRKADWRNDEPLGQANDCRYDRGKFFDRGDDRCVVR
jgi:hypothetical protein